LPPNAGKNSLEPNGWLLTVERSVMGSRQASRAALRVEQGGCKKKPAGTRAFCSSVEVEGWRCFCLFSAKTMTARNALHKAFLIHRQSGAEAIK